MNFKFLLMTLLLPAMLIPTAVNSATVTVKINQKSYSFTERPRLDEVLAPQALSQQWYWPASKLFLLNNQPALQRQQILQQLKTLTGQADDNLLPALAALQNELSGWQLGQRIPIRIDYDLARANIALNPRFEAGEYLLLLTERPAEVHFFGALRQSVTMEHRGATAVRDYLNDLALLPDADKAQVTIIQPDGVVLKAGVQSWNKQHIELMPGAMVYVPFAQGWFSADFSKLNQQIPALAVHRMY